MIRSRFTAYIARCGLLLVFTSGTRTLAAPSDAAREFTDTLPERAVVVTAPGSGAVEALRGLSVPVGRGSAAAEGTRAWVLSAAEAFGLDPADDGLVVDRVEPLALGRTRVTLRQTWRGIPVSGADARAVVSPQGELHAISSTLGSVAPDAARADVSRERALAVAADAARATLSRHSGSAQLVIRRVAGADRLAWEVALERDSGLPVRVWVSATQGDVLEPDEGVARAVGLAYPTDPRQAVTEVALERLLPAEGLASRALAIEDQQGPKVSPIGPGDYRFPPAEPAFDQVNAYWHADRFVNDFLASLGYAGPPESLIVRVHSPLEPNVAVTSGRFVHLGRAIAGFTQDAARCHDIIYHEIVHAVLYGKDVQPGGVRREASALHEALADYFAAAITHDPAIGEWVYLLFPQGGTRVDMPVDPWNAAHYDQVSFASAPTGSAWANGMILSSTLWDLRSTLGATCDSLVLEAMDLLPSVPTWGHFANALLQADSEWHGGWNGAAITTALLRRGIRGVAVADFSGPTQLDPGVVGEFRAEPCCGEVVGGYRWRTQVICRGVPCGEWQWLGEGRVLRASFADETMLELQVSSPWGDTLRKARRIALGAPRLSIEGPSRVLQHSRASWRARTVATAPSDLTWERAWRRPNSFFVVLGRDAVQSLDVDTSCVLRVTLRDGLGRRTEQLLSVETFRDRPPPSMASAFRVTVVMPPGARFGEVRYELRSIDPLRIELLDVTGRLLEVLADGPAKVGERVLRFRTADLASGVYLLRVRQGPDVAVRRFAVVH